MLMAFTGYLKLAVNSSSLNIPLKNFLTFPQFCVQKRSFIANEKLTTPLNHLFLERNYVMRKSVVWFLWFFRSKTLLWYSIYRLSYSRWSSVLSGTREILSSPSSFVTVIVVLLVHFLTISLITGAQVGKRKTKMTNLESQFKTHFNQFPLPIIIRYSGPSSSMSGKPCRPDWWRLYASCTALLLPISTYSSGSVLSTEKWLVLLRDRVSYDKPQTLPLSRKRSSFSHSSDDL